MSVPAGTASNTIIYRTLVSASASTYYWYPSTTAASSNTNFQRNASRSTHLIPYQGSNIAYMYKDSSGKVWMANGSVNLPGVPMAGQLYEWNGSIGTPIA